MFKRRMISAVTVAIAVPAAITLAASPAAAISSVAVSGTCGYSGYAQSCEAYAQDVPGLGTGADVTVVCTATTGRLVEATVVGCYIRGNNGDVHTAPHRLTNGQSSTQTHTFDSWNLLSRTYQVCVGAGYYHNSTYRGPAGYTCGTTI